MAELWMDVDAALSEVPVNLMPLIDDTDFKSIEATVAYNAGGLVLVWNFVTCAGAFTQTAVTPTTGGVYDWANQGNGMYSLEIPASGGGTINNDTEGFGWFTGVATGVLPWRGPIIGFRAAGLNDSLIETGTGLATADEVNTAVEGGAVGTAAAAIQAVTDVIPDAGALTDLLAAIAAIQAVTDAIPDAGALTNLLAAIAAIQAVTDEIPDAGALTALIASIEGLNDLSAADVNAEVVDALATDTYAEPGRATPAATLSLAAKIGYLFKAWRNKKDNNGTVENLYNDDASTVDQKAAVSESEGTVTKGEFTTGP